MPKILVTPRLFRLFIRKGSIAMAFWPFVLVRNEDLRSNEVVMRHEAIHLRQQRELLVIPFYIIYLLEFIYFLLCSKSVEYAYRAISFEREAYEHDRDPDYLRKRSRYAMWRQKS